jgi:cell division protein FtsX
MATPQVQAVRRWIMTGAVAAITVTGTLYGAGLKTDQEVKQERKRYQQASPEEIISQLQIARDDLVMKKNELERKIAGFHEKKKVKELEALKQQQQVQQPK